MTRAEIGARALLEVMIERDRQQHKEGFTPEHDEQWTSGQMAGAAACYALYRSHVRPEEIMGEDLISMLWPWDDHWWNPKDRRRDLVRAAALLLAEIERIYRAEAQADVGAK